MPATWRANRPPRPQVSAKIGGKAPAGLGQDPLLDFQMEVTLDGERLTTAESAGSARFAAGELGSRDRTLCVWLNVIAHPSALPAGELKSPSPRRLNGVDLVITSYGSLLRVPWIAETAWHLVVVDEAQAIKNPDAKQTRTVKGLKARARFALTGTPIENRLGDLWSIFDFVNPGLLGSSKEFTNFVKGLANRPHNPYRSLRELVRPYILRRLKTDKAVIADLPGSVTLFMRLARILRSAIVLKPSTLLRELRRDFRRRARTCTLEPCINDRRFVASRWFDIDAQHELRSWTTDGRGVRCLRLDSFGITQEPPEYEGKRYLSLITRRRDRQGTFFDLVCLFLCRFSPLLVARRGEPGGGAERKIRFLVEPVR